MCPAFSLLVLEAMSYISTEVGITGRNSVYWELPLPPSPWVLVRSGALALASPTQGCRRGFHSTAAQLPELKAETGALLVPHSVPRWGSTEHRTSQERGLSATWASAVGELCKGWGTAVTTKLCFLPTLTLKLFTAISVGGSVYRTFPVSN